MSTEARNKIIAQLRSEGYGAALSGVPRAANPHKYMDAIRWYEGWGQGAAEIKHVEDQNGEQP